ncbi:RNA exonuclease 1 homolog [Ischnura elegans]|uniref:RNA exonuclease 1 homolog n=1 Tax=Ischnura elegans TaxID=197161 RepID=UPI001ED8BA89|nr:RNA exonuclease 1 homolog [Ischnura elegans]
MLPSSGYFQTINCPFYDSGLCDRSYCHYRHVKKDPSSSAKESGSTEVSSTSILDVGENHDILQQLVSEAVKKALRDTELSASTEGDAGSSNSSGGTEEVSSKLVEKVIEGLKPLVARSPPPLPIPAVTPSVPSYKPTPIAELRKRHIPVPYTPKDTKTILVKRQLRVDAGSHLARIKPASKRREEYVPATSGKALDSEKSGYKPYGAPSYGEVCYSPAETTITTAISYTPSDKSSLPIKTSDYVPTGFSDTLLPNAFYEPTNRGDSPTQEPEYQPDAGSSSSKLVSYIPSKLEGSKENSNSGRNSDVLSPEDNSISQLSLPVSISEVSSQNNEPVKQTFSTKIVTSSKVDIDSEGISETESGALKCSVSDSCPSASVQIKSKSESKEKDRSKSSSKHSVHRKDSKNHKTQQETKESKSRSASQDQKDSKDLKDSKHHRVSGELKDSKTKEVKHHKPIKDGHASKDSKHIKNSESHDKLSINKCAKESKDAKDRHKRKSVDEHDGKSKRPRVDSSEEPDRKKKERTGNSSSKVDSKLKPESTHHKHSTKDKKTSDEKHSNSHSKHTGSSHTSHKVKLKHKIESSGQKESNEPEVKKPKSSASSHSNNKKSEHRRSSSERRLKELKKRPQTLVSFEEVEALLKERIQEGNYLDCLSMEDSDTDEDTRNEECLRIFNSYKPEGGQDNEETHKKARLGEKESETAETGPSGKKRVAHEGAALLNKTPVVPRKVFDPALAMVKRLAKLRQGLPDISKSNVPSSGLQTSKPKESSVEVQFSSSAERHPKLKGAMPREQSSEVPLLQPKSLSGKRRIAHVPNVSKLLDAKEKIIAGVQNAKSEPTKSQTVPKGGQRVAHIPPKEVTCRPIISSVDGTKIPTNVRQKYCNLMFDELLKKLESEEECCRLALEEEESCYGRSSSRNVYVNLAIIAIQRLRNWVAPQGKDESSGGSKLSVSHDNVIGGKSKAQGLWSIMPPKKLPGIIDESAAYNLLMEKYVMTEAELVENGYPRECATQKGKAIMMETIFRSKTKSKSYFERICDRCGKEFFVNEKGIPNDDQCVFHWGRAFKTRGFGELETRYSCCQGEARSEGCTEWNCHVCDMFDPENLKGFVQTLEKVDSSVCKVYALDCEMCYTTEGLELTRITVINYEGETVYDTLVKPEKKVLDYCTRFSGIDEKAMEGVTKRLIDVQAALLSLFDKRTILIGHSLDSDLKSLKLIHDTVVDTSLVFPHRRGPPFKRALKTLCAEYLNKLIQTGEDGHDSAEDALACMQLMKWKLKEDLKTK